MVTATGIDRLLCSREIFLLKHELEGDLWSLDVLQEWA